MHNGVFKTLEEVVGFYNKGGGLSAGADLPNLTLPFDKLNLTPKEEKDVVAFLKKLTDTGKY
jgi:cytochrome c peroxidase